MARKDFFITAVQMLEIDGSANVPTALVYQSSGRPLIGYAATVAGRSQPDAIVEDFKIELGNGSASGTPRRRFRGLTKLQ